MSAQLANDLDRLLARRRELMSRDTATASFQSRLRELREWQAARLARTYADLHQNPRYAQAVDFFLSDLYGPHDFAAREREMMRAWRYLRHSLPEAPLHALGRALELDVLTAELDHAMVAALPSGAWNESSYAQAYRRVGRRPDRERQIELAVRSGEDLDRAVRHPWVGVVLKTAHAPAHAAGFGVLQDFIERGYRAFKAMGGAREFLAVIRERETALMEALFAGARK
ncbi:MAG TPA: hypothetical protein VG994_01475 [Steroidobacteraceae bacterium]|nr:hypothetical protein [Steroidobacteraceae bacterium]